jgi:HAD superfamily phosphoserine phosphatase-like hydrolase
MMRFIFDLDGTVSAEETLPLIASCFHIEEEIAELTQATISGNIPFIESFIKRVHLLSQLPVSEINELLGHVRLYPDLLDFIQRHKQNCVIATGNLDCWVDMLLTRIGVESHTSSAVVQDNLIVKIRTILRKEDIVTMYQKRGDGVVFIGDGNNDMEAMRLSNVSIASGLTHTPANSVLSIADYLVVEESALCRLLSQLL